MIRGVGIDLVEIDRVADMLKRHGEAFTRRILHDDEGTARLARNDGPTHLAGLFAAKEAVMKALGTGMAGAGFKEIAVVHEASGQPRVRLHGGAAAKAEELGIREWHLPLTHSRTTAAAVAIGVG